MLIFHLLGPELSFKRWANPRLVLSVQNVSRPENHSIPLNIQWLKSYKSGNLQLQVQVQMDWPLEKVMDTRRASGDIYIHSLPVCVYRGWILTSYWLGAVWSMVRDQRSWCLSADKSCWVGCLFCCPAPLWGTGDSHCHQQKVSLPFYIHTHTHSHTQLRLQSAPSRLTFFLNYFPIFFPSLLSLSLLSLWSGFVFHLHFFLSLFFLLILSEAGPSLWALCV